MTDPVGLWLMGDTEVNSPCCLVNPENGPRGPALVEQSGPPRYCALKMGPLATTAPMQGIYFTTVSQCYHV